MWTVTKKIPWSGRYFGISTKKFDPSNKIIKLVGEDEHATQIMSISTLVLPDDLHAVCVRICEDFVLFSSVFGLRLTPEKLSHERLSQQKEATPKTRKLSRYSRFEAILAHRRAPICHR